MSQAIRPFHVEIPQSELDRLHSRLAEARWPTELADIVWSRGIPQPHLGELAYYWHTTYYWRAQETALNVFPQFTTEIDGRRIHFLHARSDRESFRVHPFAKPHPTDRDALLAEGIRLNGFVALQGSPDVIVVAPS